MHGAIGVGLIGYGYAGRSFHSYLVSLERRMRLVAVSARDTERRKQAEREWGVKTYPTAKSLFDDGEVDLVVVATPHNTHAELTIKALKAGKHAVVDKIMCMNAREADAMILARNQSKRSLSVFHNRRWDGDFLTLQKLIRDGLLGKLYQLELTHLRYGPFGNWRGEKAIAGGLLCDWGAHFVDQALLLAGSPCVSVHCIIQSVKWGQDIGDNGIMTATFKDGGCARIWIGNVSKASRPHWFALGTEGSFVKEGVDPQEKAMCERNIYAAKEDPAFYGELCCQIKGLEHRSRVATLPGDWTAYYRNIADHLLDGKPLAVTPESVREAMRVFDAAHLSASKGQVVKITAE